MSNLLHKKFSDYSVFKIYDKNIGLTSVQWITFFLFQILNLPYLHFLSLSPLLIVMMDWSSIVAEELNEDQYEAGLRKMW